MPCLYTANKTVIFGGVTGSQFVFKAPVANDANKPGADVKITAGTSIKFKPGVKCEKGAKLYAKCGTVVNGAQKAAIIKPAKPAVTYLTPSPFNNKVFDYSEKEIPALISGEVTNTRNLTMYPNPVKELLTINFNGQWLGGTKVQLRNIYGQMVIDKIIQAIHLQSIDMAMVTPGIYFVSITNGSKTYNQKIVKQ